MNKTVSLVKEDNPYDLVKKMNQQKGVFASQPMQDIKTGEWYCFLYKETKDNSTNETRKPSGAQIAYVQEIGFEGDVDSLTIEEVGRIIEEHKKKNSTANTKELKGEITDKQKKFLERRGFKVPDGMTKKQAHYEIAKIKKGEI